MHGGYGRAEASHARVARRVLGESVQEAAEERRWRKNAGLAPLEGGSDEEDEEEGQEGGEGARGGTAAERGGTNCCLT